ncbi:MAG: hypothetical protein AB8F78_09415 [Saprospiraceae bacterium]
MNHDAVLQLLKRLGEAVRLQVAASLRDQSADQRAAIYQEGVDDTIFQIDRDVEQVLLPILKQEAAALGGIAIIAEGLAAETLGVAEGEEPALSLLCDPIDGTRGIMYDKRSAFFLAGFAPYRVGATLRDIEVAVMIELPTSRAYLSDTLWAIRGQGATRETLNILTGELKPAALTPSKAKTIYQGFGQVVRFFPPGRAILAAIDDEVVQTLLPDAPAGKAMSFEDQYISSGGQQYELLVGHDRWVADIRTRLFDSPSFVGKTRGHCCHPYDLAASLIAEEAGVVITDTDGQTLDCPLDTTSDVDWIGYANTTLRESIQPVLLAAMKAHGL